MEYDLSVVVSTENNPVDQETFFDLFIDWVEKNGWHCGGGVSPVKYEEE